MTPTRLVDHTRFVDHRSLTRSAPMSQAQHGHLPPTAGRNFFTHAHVLRAMQTYLHGMPEKIGTTAPYNLPDDDVHSTW